MKHIVITEFMDGPAVDSLRTHFDVVYDPLLVDQPAALRNAVSTTDALIVRNRTQVNTTLLDAAPGLRVVGRLGVGLDNIDIGRCKARNIAVIPATGANALAVAEYVVGTALLLLRGAYRASAEVGTGRWPRASLSEGREIHGKCLGLVGFGVIGQQTAGLARGLGMTVVGHDPAFGAGASVWAQHAVKPLALDALLGTRRCREPARSTARFHAQPDRRSKACPDETRCGADQHGARRHCRRGRARRRR